MVMAASLPHCFRLRYRIRTMHDAGYRILHLRRLALSRILMPLFRDLCREHDPSSRARHSCRRVPKSPREIYTLPLHRAWLAAAPPAPAVCSTSGFDCIAQCLPLRSLARSPPSLLSSTNHVAGVDTRGKGPLLNLEAPGSVWPPPRSGRVGLPTDGEDPLLRPFLLPEDLDDISDDCFLDHVDTQVCCGCDDVLGKKKVPAVRGAPSCGGIFVPEFLVPICVRLL